MERDESLPLQFTDAAQRIIRHIEERAAERGMLDGELTEATVGMLAVRSIVLWERKVALAALEHLGADLDRFGHELDDAIKAEGQASRDPNLAKRYSLPNGQQCIEVDTQTCQRPLLDQAEAQAISLRHADIGTEHLLLAAVRTACPRFRDLLDRHGITLDRVRQAVREVLGEAARN